MSEEEMDDLRHRMEILEGRMKEMRDENKLFLSQLKRANKLNDLLLIRLIRDHANNNDLNKSHRYKSDSFFLHQQTQFRERINKLKDISKSLNKPH